MYHIKGLGYEEAKFNYLNIYITAYIFWFFLFI
jgi:hypothetical protein